MPNFSHSRISKFETCPLQYKYSYIDNIDPETEDTVEIFLGKLVHEALQKLYDDLKFEKRLTKEELIEFFNKIWKENWNNNIVINKKELKEDHYRKTGIRCIEQYYEQYTPFTHEKVIGIETQNLLELDKEHKFHIRIDRLVERPNGIYEVHDYKTNGRLLTQKDLDEDEQLAMYSFWVKQNYKDCKKIILVWHFLLFNKEMRSERTIEQLKQLKEEVLEQIKEIEATKKFPAKVSKLCDYCAYQYMCPSFKHKFSVEEKPANEYLKDPGVKLVNEYAKIKAEQKKYDEEAEEKLEKLKEALIAFCKKNDIEVVVGSDNKITVKEYESIKLPGKNTKEREELIKVLKQMKKYDELLDLDTHLLAKVIKDQEWSSDQLKKLKPFETIEKDHRITLGKK